MQHFVVVTNSVCKILLAKCTRSAKVVLSHQNYRRILGILRGYRHLKASNGLDRIIPLHRALTITKIGSCKDVYSKLIFGASTNTAELAIRQWMKMRAGNGSPLNSALYYSQGRTRGQVAHYIPTVWQAIIREYGFPVAVVKSNLMWFSYVFKHMCSGIFNFVKIAGGSASQIFRKIGPFHGRYVYFDDLSDSQIPHSGTDSQSFDIFSWYLKWPERVPNLTVLVHGRHKLSSCTRNGTPILGTIWPVPLFTEPRALVQFLAWGFAAISLSFLDLFRGRWWHALMLRDATVAALVRFQSPDQLGREYMFNQSRVCYRPLYTYEAEQRGSQITFYFYSINSEGINQNPTASTHFDWLSMNWPRYLVWDSYQADFVKSMVGDGAMIKIVGSIWFAADNIKVLALPKTTIAIFDVVPARASIHCLLVPQDIYYIPSTTTQFLTDSFDCITAIGASGAFKSKRQLNYRHHPQYIRFVEKISDEWDKIVTIDPNSSAYSLIEKCSAVISMPFTSTAYIARELGKPSCFYDPTGMIQRDDRAAHGILIISGREELQTWIGSLELPGPTR